MRKQINTVLGAISPEELGQTLMHEHITCADWSMRMNFGDRFYQQDKVVEMAAGQLKKVADMGLKTFVDGTPVNLGRDIQLLRAVQEKTGMNIIASSGFYFQEEPWLAIRDEEQIYDLISYECKNGIAGTDSLPGIMKNGTTAAGVTPLQKKLLQINGRVAVEEQLPIFCHHDPVAQTGPAIMETYAEVGVKPSQVILGHSCDTNDIGYLRAISSLGCYIGFDRLAYERENTTESMVNNILTLCQDGYLNRILLSHDWASYLAFWDSWETTVSADYLNLDVDFSFVHRKVVPMLKAGGLTEADVNTMLVENPKRFLSLAEC
jgi:phosphotriesterase-related protein